MALVLSCSGYNSVGQRGKVRQGRDEAPLLAGFGSPQAERFHSSPGFKQWHQCLEPIDLVVEQILSCQRNGARVEEK